MNTSSLSYSDIPLFAGIDPKNLEALLGCLGAYHRTYKKGEFIILDQQEVHYLGIILSGTVHMLKEDIWGHQTLLGYMHPGEMIGETFAMRKIQNSYVSFQAASETEVLFVTAFNIIHSCPNRCIFHQNLTQNMFDLLGQKSVALMEKIEVSSKSTLRDKILAYLSMQAQKQNSRYIELPLNRTELAEYLGANRSALSRELSHLKEEGLIDFERNTFTLNEERHSH